MLTKQQERELIDKLISQVPHGYVRDLLREARPAWLSAIDSDHCFAGIGELHDQKNELRNEVAKLHRDIRDLGIQVDQLKRQRDNLIETLQGVSDRLSTSISIARKSAVTP